MVRERLAARISENVAALPTERRLAQDRLFFIKKAQTERRSVTSSRFSNRQGPPKRCDALGLLAFKSYAWSVSGLPHVFADAVCVDVAENDHFNRRDCRER